MIRIFKSMSRAARAAAACAMLTVGALGLAMPAAAPAQAAESETGGLYEEVGESGLLTVGANDVGATRRIAISPGKALIVELPKPVRDLVIGATGIIESSVQTDKRVYLFGRIKGQTNAVFFDKDGNRFLTLDIKVVGDKNTALDELFRQIMPSADIRVETIGKLVLLTGTVRTVVDATRATEIARNYLAEHYQTPVDIKYDGNGNITQAQAGTGIDPEKIQIINMLSVEAKEQVMLKVQVVEMNRQVIKQLGVDISATATAGSTTFNMISATPFSSYGKNLFDGGALPGGGYMANGVGLQQSSDKFSIDKVLKAMERNGMTRTLAEPNLTAISGETAKFHAGGEFPIPVAQDSNKVTVEWKKFGVLLNFTPVVMSEGRISMQIKTEVSELSQEGAIQIGYLNLPGIATRNAETTVELPSGGSLMMAGLLSDSTRQAINGLPGLKNLPILGSLFRSRDYIRQESELVVLVTPYVVKPVNPGDLKTPDAGFAPASDAKGNLLGHLNRVYGRRESLPQGEEHGDYGFIVE
jgi:pilus assembly protein CpaC